MYYQNSNGIHPEEDELESLMPGTETVETHFQSRSNNQPSNYLHVFGKISLLVISVLSILFLVVNNTQGEEGANQIHSVNPLTTQLMSFQTVLSDVKSSSSLSLSKDISITDISISVSSPGYSALKALDLLPWIAIAEPHRVQYMNLDSVKVNGQRLNLDTVTVSWSIDGKRFEGASAKFTVLSTGMKNCTVTLLSKEATTDADNSLPAMYSVSHDFQIAAKYVRRELRALTDDDRTAFFDALYMMYTVEEELGVAKYGSKFKTAEYYLFKHLNGAGTSDCDHWHDGAGIVTHHTAFTLEVEQTLQAINPTISMPYWEYGMDSILYGDQYQDSPIFNEDWFGQANPLNSKHEIDTGRWSKIKMPSGSKYAQWDIQKTGKLNPFVNPYGIMRSPWNRNPSQFITRHNDTYGMTQYPTMPSCSVLRSCFFSRTVKRMNDCFNGATHGPVHIKIGGAWGEGDTFSTGSAAVSPLWFLQNPDKLLLFKVLWRMGYTRCPSDCTGIKEEDCKCAVPQEYIDKFGAKNILITTNVYYILSKFINAKSSDDFYLQILRAIEDPGIAGEMFTSAASFDPTFWPLHGAAERLLDYKRLLYQRNLVDEFDESWGYPDFDRTSGAAYVPGICDWSEVTSNSDLTLPSCTLDVTCPGHNEHDVLEFSDFLGLGETYTNKEFFEFIHPANEALPYTYDTFDYDYCRDSGYDFMDSIAYADAVAQETMEVNGGDPGSLPDVPPVPPSGPITMQSSNSKSSR